jgi:glycosyltransferase A (GT-A) superfamily protein (DUF2064 family)
MHDTRRGPALLTGIDWGASRVYHQTLAAAERVGRRIPRLQPWHDTDPAADLGALLARLDRQTTDRNLLDLRDRLKRLTDATG